MSPVVFPTAVKAHGNQSVVIIQTVATPASVSLATEINAASSVNATMYLFRGSFQPTAETQKGEAPPRLGETKVREEFGDTRYSISDLQYVHSPQAASTDTANKVRAALPEGSTVYVLERLGLSGENVDYAASQKYRLHHIRCGAQVWGRTSDDQYAEFCINQSVSYVSPPIDGTVVA